MRRAFKAPDTLNVGTKAHATEGRVSMGKKKKRRTARTTQTRQPSRLEAFSRQDPYDPRTYAGRKHERVSLGGVGDDGLPMTRSRLNTHRTLNVFFIWGLACVAIGVITGAASFFQGGAING